MSDMSIGDVTMVPITGRNGEVVGYEDEVNQRSMPLIQERLDSYETAQNYEKPRATFSAEDIVGLIFCLGGLNPLCMTGCSLGGPSKKIAEQAIRERIVSDPDIATMLANQARMPGWGNLSFPYYVSVKGVEIEVCEVREIGTKQPGANRSLEKIEYWPVKVYIKASGRGYTAWMLGGEGEEVKIDRVFEFGVYKDKFGNWVAGISN